MYICKYRRWSLIYFPIPFFFLGFIEIKNIKRYERSEH